jgi:cytochrome P450
MRRINERRILWTTTGFVLLSIWWQMTSAHASTSASEDLNSGGMMMWWQRLGQDSWEFFASMSTVELVLIVLSSFSCSILLYCAFWYQQQLHATQLYGMPVMHSPKEGQSFPFLGQLLNFIRYRPWDLLTNFHHRYGPIVCFPLLGKNMFSIASPELLKIVLQSKIQAVKKDVQNTMQPFLVILGTGIVTSEDQSWMHQRVKMSQPLRRDVLEMIPAQTLTAVQKLMIDFDQAAKTGQKVPLGASLRHLTLQVISGTFLSLSAQESDETFAKLYLPIVDESNTRVWHPYRAYMPFMPFWWKYLWNVRRLNTYVSSLIRQRWTLRREEGGTKERDILDKVLAVYEKLDCKNGSIPQHLPEVAVRQFRDEMKTFMLAGHETSAAMMTWALYELIGNEERLLQPLLQEACQVFGKTTDWSTASPTNLPDADCLHQLKVSEAFLKESLRKYSVVPIVARRTVQDLRMDKQYFIPKGSSILINIQAVHWNPDLWEEPKRFDPNRFLTGTEPEPYTFLPFIAGPRNCLGQHLALLESKMVISWLAQRYKLELDEPVETNDWTGGKDPRHRYMVPVIPKEELMVRVQRRSLE